MNNGSSFWGIGLGACGVGSLGGLVLWLGLAPSPLPSSVPSESTVLQHMIDVLGSTPSPLTDIAHPAPRPTFVGPLHAITEMPQWLNARALRDNDLRGKVILVNFWTYSCINSLRMLPYTRAWAEKYKKTGLIVIGVHTPEFGFEKDISNVTKAAKALQVTYPIATDNDFHVWQVFRNQGWPGLYFFDADGRLRHQVLGEGGYDKSEKLIQHLLAEANHAAVPADTAVVIGNGPQLPADDQNLNSRETYIGYAQSANMVPAGRSVPDGPYYYRTVSAPPINHWGLSGNWTVGREFASLNGSSGKIVYRFHARDLHLVLEPPPDGRDSIRYRVKIDGAAPGASHGFDVDSDGWGYIEDARMYQLIRQTGVISDRTFEIEFFGPGVRAYSVTFG